MSGWCSQEPKQDSRTTKRALDFFFPPLLSGERRRYYEERQMRKNRRGSSPRIHCGWLWEDGTRGLQRKSDKEGVTNKKRKREEGEQQFDSRFSLSSSTLQKFFFFLLQMSSFRTSWDPRRTLASGSRLSRTWGNPRHCSCQEPVTKTHTKKDV